MIFQDLSPDWTFENFIIYPSNQKAYDAALERSNGTSQPLIISSSVGCGKSHLMHSIGHRIKSKGKVVGSLTGEHFCVELWGAIKRRHEACFFKKFEELDVLLVDWFYPLMVKNDSQMKKAKNEFKDIVELFLNQSKLVIIATCPTPDEIIIFDDWEIVKIADPDNETNKLYLSQQISKWLKIPPPNDIFQYLVYLSEKVSSFRVIENRVIRLNAFLEFKYQSKYFPNLIDVKELLSEL